YGVLLLPALTTSVSASSLFFSAYAVHPGLHSFPTRRSSDLGLEGLGRYPAQFALNLASIYRIAAIMTRTVRHMSNLLSIAYAVGPWPQLVQQITYGVDDLEIGLFIPAANVVDLTR